MTQANLPEDFFTKEELDRIEKPSKLFTEMGEYLSLRIDHLKELEEKDKILYKVLKRKWMEVNFKEWNKEKNICPNSGNFLTQLT